MAAVDLLDVTKRFGEYTAVDGLTLHVDDKEFVALLGPSGCGKSTTMNMISGIETPCSGRILFDGSDMRDVSAQQRGVGFVFQNYAIFTHLSVRDNLSFGLRMRKRPKSEMRRLTTDMAETMRLSDKLDLPAGKLNTNEMQRLAIGRAAILHPAIFLLDEPLSNLDATFRARMRTELKLLQREHRQTMVYVTHDQLEAMSMADRIAVMSAGRLQQYGTPLDVYNKPGNMFVARFLGSPSMNLLSCRLRSEGQTFALDFGPAGQWTVTAAALAAQCRAAGGQDVVFGIRPEKVKLGGTGGDRGSLAMTVAHVERIGSRTIIYLENGRVALTVVQGNGYGIAIGDKVLADVADESALLFDPSTGMRIAQREAGVGQS